METKKIISILVPCYNEEANLQALFDAVANQMSLLNAYDWELLLINDGSFDNTLSVIESLASEHENVHYVSLSRNFGKEAAMLAGFDYVRGDCVVVMDADLQDPPEMIPKMLEHWENGFEDVYARRCDRGRESFFRKRLSLCFYKVLQKSTKIDVLANVGDFRLLDKRCVNALREFRESERYTKGFFAWIGFKKKEILFDRGNRKDGHSAWNFLSLLNLAINGLTSFTTAPLRLATILGLLLSFIAFLYMSFVLIKALLYGDPVAGYPSMMVIILFLGGVQLLCLGLIGEYLARIFNESKHRPVYIVGKTNVEK